MFVLHILKKDESKNKDLINFKEHSSLKNVLYFETCLRKIWIAKNKHSLDLLTQNHSDAHLLKDDNAYHFLLEVICGLKSPIIGETEVFGQFKNQILKKIDNSHILFKEINGLVTDTKMIRSKYLKNLGSSSYGSLARKYLVGYEVLDIIGAGEFVQSLKPWIEKLNLSTTSYTRNPNKYDSIYLDSKINLMPLVEYFPQSCGKRKALFICAPTDLKDKNLSIYDLIIDFRDSDSKTPIQHKNIKVLSEVFEEIKNENVIAEQRKKEALVEVEKQSLAFITAMNHRPFGWDDLSA